MEVKYVVTSTTTTEKRSSFKREVLRRTRLRLRLRARLRRRIRRRKITEREAQRHQQIAEHLCTRNTPPSVRPNISKRSSRQATVSSSRAAGGITSAVWTSVLALVSGGIDKVSFLQWNRKKKFTSPRKGVPISLHFQNFECSSLKYMYVCMYIPDM